jgi:hypothetical protein
MSNGMTVTVPVTDESDSTNQLKSIFDQSLAVLCEGEDTVKTGLQSERLRRKSLPLRRKSLPLRIDAVNLQKRALDNAAKALATLWKISEPKRTKLQSRVTQYSRSTS